MAMIIIVASRLAGAVQLMHVPTIEKVSLTGAATRFVISSSLTFWLKKPELNVAALSWSSQRHRRSLRLNKQYLLYLGYILFDGKGPLPPDFSHRKDASGGVADSRLSRSAAPIYCRLTMMFYRLFTRQFISGRDVCLGVFLCRFLVALRRD
jgi:hypothetical protein